MTDARDMRMVKDRLSKIVDGATPYETLLDRTKENPYPAAFGALSAHYDLTLDALKQTIEFIERMTGDA